MTDTLDLLAEKLQAFAHARDWEQFHAPKNLACALAVEAGELLEHFQWMTEAQSQELAPEKRTAVAAEMADVLLYLVQLATRMNVDLKDAALRKIEDNERRYPVDRSRGTSRKHDEL